jgi:hypothetical protein
MDFFLDMMEERIKKYRQEVFPSGQPLFNLEALSI